VRRHCQLPLFQSLKFPAPGTLPHVLLFLNHRLAAIGAGPLVGTRQKRKEVLDQIIHVTPRRCARSIASSALRAFDRFAMFAGFARSIASSALRAFDRFAMFAGFARSIASSALRAFDRFAMFAGFARSIASSALRAFDRFFCATRVRSLRYVRGLRPFDRFAAFDRFARQ